MKKHTFIRLLLTISAALCLAAVILLYAAEQPTDQLQTVSFAVERFPAENDAQISGAAALPQEASVPKKEEPADDGNAIDDGFDLADSLLPADLYLEKVKDFQADVERAAAQSQRSAPN